LTVDNPEDLQVARLIYESIGKNGEPIPMRKIISFLNAHPEVVKINSHIMAGKAKLW
jgi:spore coat polysaccharide biosynthesis protein SpsF (cytidylyltransferase family)